MTRPYLETATEGQQVTSAPSLAQVRAQVKSIREKFQEARAIAIRLAALDAAATVPATLRIDSEDLPVFRSDSVLALRERLVELPDDGPPLVVLTDLPQAELGGDLLARFARRTIFSIDPWQLVKEQFQARSVDPRLSQNHPWVARALLDTEPHAAYAPVPSGFLDAETAWRHLFATVVGTRRGERDPEALLAWAIDEARAGKLNALSDAVRTGLAAAVETSTGRAARLIFECATRFGRRAVSVGLVAGVLFDPQSTGDERAARAAGKLEALLGLLELDADQAHAWTDAAERVVLRQRRSVSADAGGPKSRAMTDAVLADADALLQELGAADLAWRSRMLRASLDQRLARLARELSAFVEGDAEEVPEAFARRCRRRARPRTLGGRAATRDRGRDGPAIGRLARPAAARGGKSSIRSGTRRVRIVSRAASWTGRAGVCGTATPRRCSRERTPGWRDKPISRATTRTGSSASSWRAGPAPNRRTGVFWASRPCSIAGLRLWPESTACCSWSSTR